MYRKLNTCLNCVIGAFIGMFAASGIYTYWDYKTHPEAYAAASAPWYTSILLFGTITAAIILAAVAMKLIIRKKGKKDRQIIPFTE